MATKARIIQVPIGEELLSKLDEVSRDRGQSRSALIREACARYVANVWEAEAERRYIESYRNDPEDPAMGIAGAKLAAGVWGEEDWSEEYAEDVAEGHATG